MTPEEYNNLASLGMTPAQIISTHLNEQFSAIPRLGMFVYGSSVYKNKKPGDIDVLVVLDTNKDISVQCVVGDYNVTVVDYNLFVMDLRDHDVVTIECAYSDAKTYLMPISPRLEHIIKSFKEQPTESFGFNVSRLRSSFSKTASNSYVKAKKKLIVPESYDLECSIKSLWHSLRILAFGATLAKTGSINFQEMNDEYMSILEVYQETNANWDEIHDMVRPMYNELSSRFRECAPKEAE